MNDNERTLLRYVVEGDIRKSQQQAKIVLEGLTTVKDIILVGTTNRPDTLDDALLRRFTFGHTVRPLCRDDARTLARMFFASVGYSASDAEIESLLDDTSQYYTASKITNLCIDHIIDWVANQEDTPCIGKV